MNNNNRDWYIYNQLGQVKWWSSCSAGTAIFAIIALAGAFILGGVALNEANNSSSLASYTSSGSTISSTPFKVRIDGASPLDLRLPNDLSTYVGKTFVITAGTAHAHTVTIESGSLTTTFDGSNNIATLGGAVGDGFVMEVIGKDRVVVFGNINTGFS